MRCPIDPEAPSKSTGSTYAPFKHPLTQSRHISGPPALWPKKTRPGIVSAAQARSPRKPAPKSSGNNASSPVSSYAHESKMNQLKKLYRDISHLESKLLADLGNPKLRVALSIRVDHRLEPMKWRNCDGRRRSRITSSELFFASGLYKFNVFPSPSEMMLSPLEISSANAIPTSLRNIPENYIQGLSRRLA
jgi:hypothetical protein